MKWSGAAALLLASAAAGTLAIPTTRSQAKAGAQNLCTAKESVIYSCRFGRKTGSVCADDERVHYRFGPAARPEMHIASTPDWGNVRLGRVVGQQGGHQAHIRFSNGETHYLVFEGADGQATRRPGRSYSGISVVARERELARLECRTPAKIHSDPIGAVRARAPEALRPRLDEEPGGFFDGWF